MHRRYAHTCIHMHTHTWYTHANTHTLGPQQYPPGNTEWWKASSTLPPPGQTSLCLWDLQAFLLLTLPVGWFLHEPYFPQALSLSRCDTDCVHRHLPTFCLQPGVEFSTVEFFHLFKNVSKWPHMHIQERERKVSGKKGPSTYALHKLMIKTATQVSEGHVW